MRYVPPAPPAAARARAAARRATACALLALLALPVVGMGVPSALAILLAAFLAMYLHATRYLSLSDLAKRGTTPVVDVAHPLPALSGATVTATEVVARLAELRDVPHVLVPGDGEWLVAQTRPLIAAALAAGPGGLVEVPATRARWVLPGVSIDHLPRVPHADEVWLVDGPEPPLAVLTDDLAPAAADAGGRPRVVRRPPSRSGGDA